MIWRIAIISLAKFWSPLITHCAECLTCPHSFTTVPLYCDTWHAVSFGVVALRHFGRDISQCTIKFNDVVVVRRFFRMEIRFYKCHLASSCFSHILAVTNILPFPFFASASSIEFSFPSLFFLSSSTFSLSFSPVGSFWFDTESKVGERLRGGDRINGNLPPPHLSVVEYIERYGDRFNVQLFCAISRAGYVREISDVCTGHMRYPAAGDWIKQGRHCGGGCTTDLLFHFCQTDSLYVCNFEKVRYERPLGYVLRHGGRSPKSDWPTDAGEAIDNKTIFFCHFVRC